MKDEKYKTSQPYSGSDLNPKLYIFRMSLFYIEVTSFVIIQAMYLDFICIWSLYSLHINA